MGVAKAPCSLAGSWRAAWTRMTRPAVESCTVAPTRLTCTDLPRCARPAAYIVPAKLTYPLASTTRVTLTPAVAIFGWRALGFGRMVGCLPGR